jgi:hypothetical protein
MNAIRKMFHGMAMVSALGVWSSAGAVIIVDTVDPDPNIGINSPGNYSYTHNFTDNSTPNDFTAGTDEITAADIQLWFSDDNGSESFNISLGDAPQVFTIDNIGNSKDFSYEISASLSALNSSGMLDVKIELISCSNNHCTPAVTFDKSVLTATASRETNIQTLSSVSAVPEPETLLLFGTGFGLLGLGRCRLRKTKKLH